MTHPFEHESTALPRRDALAFAPLHKRHFGTAIGAAAALIVAGLTVLDLLLGRPETSRLWLLNQYFTGYTVSWPGALIGGLWAFFVGWVAGWFVAFCRNFAIAGMVFWVRARANFQASRDFLDHL